LRPDRRLLAGGTLALLAALSAAGCRQDMHDAPRYKPLAESAFFADGASARPLPAGTVARGDLRADKLFYTGRLPDDSVTAELPVPVDRALLLRGRQRFDIYCAPCHGRLGEGNGMVVRRGYKPPASYHEPRLREAPIGYFFDVMTHGFGVMPAYAAQVPAHDRWAIAAWIRVLQRSQHFDAGELSAEERARLEPTAAPEPPAAPGQAGH
jgi:mono/diheme cytochrome c family protein